MLATQSTDQATYQKEMYAVLSSRNDNVTSFGIPKGLTDEELLALMRERKTKNQNSWTK